MAHPAAKLGRQATGQAEPQGRIIDQDHRESRLSQHQAPALVEQVVAEVGAVGQGLPDGAIQGNRVGQRWIPQIHHHRSLQSQITLSEAMALPPAPRAGGGAG